MHHCIIFPACIVETDKEKRDWISPEYLLKPPKESGMISTAILIAVQGKE